MAFTGLTLKPFNAQITEDAFALYLMQFDLTLSETLTPFGYGAISNTIKWNLNIVGELKDGYSDGYGGSGFAARYEFTTRYNVSTDIAQILDDEPIVPVYLSPVEGDALDWTVTIHIVGPYLLIQVQGDDGEPVSWMMSGDALISFEDLEA